MRNSKQETPIDRPVFLVGMGRSGTTLIFESLARNRELGWFSHRLDRAPAITPLAGLARLCDASDFFRKEVVPSAHVRRQGERFRDGPSEAYGVWRRLCGEKFLFEYLLDAVATPEERRRTREFVGSVLRWQGKRRFAAKLTGPARLGFLMSLFPDAHFIHVARDGRAVVDSLLNVDFWRQSFRMREPAWRGGLTPEDLERWEAHGRDPLVLAALQWRRVVLSAWQERDRHRPRVFHELRHEDFLSQPVASMQQICTAVGVDFDARARSWLGERRGLRAGPPRFRERLGGEQLELLDELLGDVLEPLGYAGPRRNES